MPKKNKISILQVLPHLGPGGVSQGTLDIAKAISSAGMASFTSCDGGERLSELCQTGSHYIHLPLASKNPLRILHNAFCLTKIIRKHGISILHARSRAPAWSALWAARMTGIPFVTTFHGTYNFNNSLKKYYNSIMTRGDRIIAISSFIGEHIQKNYTKYCNPSKIRLVHRGIDMNFFSPLNLSPAQINQQRQLWGCQPGQKLVLMAGRLSRWKGQKTLLEALRFLPRGSFRCVFAGSSQGRKQYLDELYAYIRSQGLEDLVIFQEHCPDMPLACAASDIVVHASTDPEAFGRVVAEAQAMGKPVIASRLGAPGEIIIDGETGWLFDPHSPAELAERLDSFSHMDVHTLELLAEKARKRMGALFSLEKMVDGTLNIYRELARNQES